MKKPVILIALAAAILTIWVLRDPPAPIERELTRQKVPADIGNRDIVPAKHIDPLVNPRSLFEPPPENTSLIAKGQTLLRRLDADPNSLNPLFYSSRNDSWLIECLFDGLFKVDRRLNWIVNNAMVESWSKSADGKVYTFTLRDGLEFHDGHPLTAHDVEFTWRIIVDDRIPVGTMRQGRDQLEVVEAVDDRTVRFVHKAVRAASRWDMVFLVLPEHILGNASERAADPSLQKSPYFQKFAFEMPIGSGPYRMIRWERGQRIELARWDGYYGPKVHFERIIFKIVKDSARALDLVRREELDEMTLSPVEFQSGTSDDAFTKVAVKAFAPSWSYYYVGWNTRKTHQILSDVKVRRAIAHAFDLPRFLEKHCYGLYAPVHGMFPATSWMYDENIESYSYDPKRAGEILDDAGWRISEDDGERYKTIDGQRTRLEFTIDFPSAAQLAPKVARVLQEDLKAIGVTVKTNAIDYHALRRRLLEGSFDAYILGWGAGTDPDTAKNIWHSSVIGTPGGRNYVAYANPRVDELFDLGGRELDPAKRALLYQEMHRLVYRDQPYLFICSIPTVWAFNHRIRGVQFSPRGATGFHPGMRDWWVHVDDAKKKP